MKKIMVGTTGHVDHGKITLTAAIKNVLEKDFNIDTKNNEKENVTSNFKDKLEEVMNDIPNEYLNLFNTPHKLSSKYLETFDRPKSKYHK